MNLRFLIFSFGLLALLPGCVERQSEKTPTQINSTALQNNTYNVVVKTNTTASIIEETPQPAKLIWTEEEEAQLKVWSRKSSKEKLGAALYGEAGAIYVIGLSCLRGGGCAPIDTISANEEFSKAASLGFVPALDKIAGMYMHTFNDLLLATVYANLIVSFGHLEFFKEYHEVSKLLSEKFGPLITQGIEKIAAHKRNRILYNQEKLKKTTDKFKFMFDLESSTSGIITNEDVLFDMDYWQKVIKGKAPKDLDKWVTENYATITKDVAKKRKASIQRIESYSNNIEPKLSQRTAPKETL